MPLLTTLCIIGLNLKLLERFCAFYDNILGFLVLAKNSVMVRSHSPSFSAMSISKQTEIRYKAKINFSFF